MPVIPQFCTWLAFAHPFRNLFGYVEIVKPLFCLMLLTISVSCFLCVWLSSGLYIIGQLGWLVFIYKDLNSVVNIPVETYHTSEVG